MGNSCGVITNVAGPAESLYSAGARLVQYYPMGVLTAGGGLFHAVFSMGGTLSITATADREAMPDPEFYRQCLDDSFAELKATVAERYDLKNNQRSEKYGRKARQKKKHARGGKIAANELDH